MNWHKAAVVSFLDIDHFQMVLADCGITVLLEEKEQEEKNEYFRNNQCPLCLIICATETVNSCLDFVIFRLGQQANAP